jgi:hypothetical protein
MVRFFLRLNEEDEEEKFPKAAEGCRTPNLECGTPVQLLDIFLNHASKTTEQNTLPSAASIQPKQADFST